MSEKMLNDNVCDFFYREGNDSPNDNSDEAEIEPRPPLPITNISSVLYNLDLVHTSHLS